MNRFARRGLRIFESRAAEYIKDKGKVKKLVNLAAHKGKKETIKEGWSNLQLIIAVLKDWINGEYKDLSKRTLIVLVAGILYFVSPVDIVSDFVPVAGFLDDITVLGFVYTQLTKELGQYKKWREEKNSSGEIIDVKVNEG